MKFFSVLSFIFISVISLSIFAVKSHANDELRVELIKNLEKHTTIEEKSQYLRRETNPLKNNQAAVELLFYVLSKTTDHPLRKLVVERFGSLNGVSGLGIETTDYPILHSVFRPNAIEAGIAGVLFDILQQLMISNQPSDINFRTKYLRQEQILNFIVDRVTPELVPAHKLIHGSPRSNRTAPIKSSDSLRIFDSVIGKYADFSFWSEQSKIIAASRLNDILLELKQHAPDQLSNERRYNLKELVEILDAFMKRKALDEMSLRAKRSLIECSTLLNSET